MFFRYQENVAAKTASFHHKKVDRLRSILSSELALDWSDFVLLSTALLKNIVGQKIEKELHDIQVMYLNNQLEAAIKSIIKICQDHPETASDKNLLALIQSRAASLFNNPLALDSRRYFETKFALALWDSLGENEFHVITKLSTLINEIDPKIEIPHIVNTLDDAEIVVDRMEKCEHASDIQTKETSIKKISAIYQIKDRGGNRIDRDKEKLFSSNPGIMKSSAYNPLDEHIPVTTNRLPDLAKIKSEVKNGYSKSNVHVPFVNSVSGHSITFAAVLERYIIKHKNNPKDELQAEVDILVKAFIGFTWKRGFHSFAEMMDTLNDPSIRDMISAHGFAITLLYANSILQSAYDKASEYACYLHLKRMANKEIISKKIEKPSGMLFFNEATSAEQNPSPEINSFKKTPHSILKQ